MKSIRIFLDGNIVKATPRLLKSLSPGIVKGKGVFETMRSYQGKIFALDDHLRRLNKGLKILRIQCSYSSSKLQSYLQDVLKVNHLKNARLRLSVWQEGQKVHTAIVCEKFPILSKKKKGFKAVISKYKLKSEKFPTIKSIQYSPFRKAFLEAKAKGYDEAILLNQNNEIVEGSRTNIFFIKDNQLFTPALTTGCLEGITRRYVMQCAKKLRFSCREVHATLGELLEADEVFLTNSIIEIVPLGFINGQKIGKTQTAWTFKLWVSLRGLFFRPKQSF